MNIAIRGSQFAVRLTNSNLRLETTSWERETGNW